MDARLLGNAADTFEPSSELIQEDDCNTLLLYLPGFTREQLRVQRTTPRVLKISGSGTIDNRWSSFHKDFPISENIDAKKIAAKFEDGILYVRLPKLTVPAEKDHKKIPPSETPQPPKPEEKSPAPVLGGTTGGMPTRKTYMQNVVKDFPEKSDEEKEENPAKKIPPSKTPQPEDEKPPAPTGGQEWGPTAPSAVQDFPAKSDEKKEEKPANKDKPKGGKKDEKNYVEERTGGDDRTVDARRTESDEREKISGSNVNAAARLKVARAKTMKILLYLFAFALGVYFSKLAWFSTTGGIKRE